MAKNQNHCCDAMNAALENPGIPLIYSCVTRNYYIPVLYRHRTCAWQCLFGCPWCGTELPKDLTSEYYDILENTFQISDEDIINNNVPEEFKSDAWWKKRGLL